MKTGTMTPSEFVSGAGMARLRREQSAEHLKQRAKETKLRCSERIGKLAYLRLALLIPWWREKFPTRQLKIIFGNGTESIAIDERYYYPPLWGTPDNGQLNRRNKLNWPEDVPREILHPLHEALHDVHNITNDYRDGTPKDLIIEPVKQRRKT